MHLVTYIFCYYRRLLKNISMLCYVSINYVRFLCLALNACDCHSVLYIYFLFILNFSFLGAFATLRKATISFVMSVCLSFCPYVRPSAWNNSAATGWIFMKLDIWVLFQNRSRNFKFHCTLCGDQLHFSSHVGSHWSKYAASLAENSNPCLLFIKRNMNDTKPSVRMRYRFNSSVVTIISSYDEPP